jgi:hypothetical protein
MNGRQSFEPYEFLDRLKRDEIYPPIVLYGMVKPAKDDDDYLLFAYGYVCENWLRIPLSSIENITVLSSVRCDDHKHPLVFLVLKQPQTDEGRLFSYLGQTTSGKAQNLFAISRERRYNKASSRFPDQRRSAQERAIPHGPDAGDLLPSCSGCPAWVDDHGWFGILVGCSDTTCDYAQY